MQLVQLLASSALSILLRRRRDQLMGFKLQKETIFTPPSLRSLVCNSSNSPLTPGTGPSSSVWMPYPPLYPLISPLPSSLVSPDIFALTSTTPLSQYKFWNLASTHTLNSDVDSGQTGSNRQKWTVFFNQVLGLHHQNIKDVWNICRWWRARKKPSDILKGI